MNGWSSSSSDDRRESSPPGRASTADNTDYMYDIWRHIIAIGELV